MHSNNNVSSSELQTGIIFINSISSKNFLNFQPLLWKIQLKFDFSNSLLYNNRRNDEITTFGKTGKQKYIINPNDKHNPINYIL